MATDDDNLFQREMSDVTPLKRVSRAGVRADTRTELHSDSMAHRRRAAEQAATADRNILTQARLAPLDAWYVLSFKRPGIQNGVFRKLRQGRYAAEAQLDLHRLSVAQARVELFDYIEQCHHLGLRTVQVVHGRGQRAGDSGGSALLKGCVDHWLRELDIVQAFHSAQPRHGGTGAVYVLLRKSAEKKQENRVKLNKGRLAEPPG